MERERLFLGRACIVLMLWSSAILLKLEVECISRRMKMASAAHWMIADPEG